MEDEALIALHLEQLVRDEGHTVVGIALDPEEARQIADLYRPHFAFVDLRLRNGTSGLDAVRYLRNDHDAPSILISGNLDRESMDAVAPLRPLAFIGKPFYPPRVTQAIASAVAAIAH